MWTPSSRHSSSRTSCAEGHAITRRLDIPTVRAAWWALRAARYTRSRLAVEPLDRVVRGLPAAPRLSDSATRGVNAVLNRRGDTCLVRSVVRQHWYAAHGDRREIVIGVTSPAAGFKAHAWLVGDSQPPGESYTEISRSAAV